MRRFDNELLGGLPLFSRVSAKSLSLLTRGVSLLRVPQFAVLVNEGTLPSVLHAIVEGTVELFSGASGRETTLDVFQAKSAFILPAVIRDEPYRQSVRTLTQARIVTIPAILIRDIYNNDDGFARGVATDLASSYDRTMDVLKDLKLHSGAERLANWILETRDAQGNNGQVTLKYPKRTLASQLGMTPENLSRNLASLAKHGVSIKGRVMTIADTEAVRRWSHANL